MSTPAESDALTAALAEMDGDILSTEQASETTPENYYPDVYTFVKGFWAPTFAHDVREQNTSWRWCSRWFHHVEAMARLEACWKAWEVLRLDPGTGASLWFRDHAGPCLAALTDPDGPFKGCSDTTHGLPDDLPTAPLPAGLTTASV